MPASPPCRCQCCSGAGTVLGAGQDTALAHILLVQPVLELSVVMDTWRYCMASDSDSGSWAECASVSHNEAAKRVGLGALAPCSWAWCLTGRHMVLRSEQPHAGMSAKAAAHQETVVCNCCAFSQRGMQLLHSRLTDCQRLSRALGTLVPVYMQ